MSRFRSLRRLSLDWRKVKPSDKVEEKAPY
jgi:hypothetical protein